VQPPYIHTLTPASLFTHGHLPHAPSASSHASRILIATRDTHPRTTPVPPTRDLEAPDQKNRQPLRACHQHMSRPVLTSPNSCLVPLLPPRLLRPWTFPQVFWDRAGSSWRVAMNLSPEGDTLEVRTLRPVRQPLGDPAGAGPPASARLLICIRHALSSAYATLNLFEL
jgi:hypothetical protein